MNWMDRHPRLTIVLAVLLGVIVATLVARPLFAEQVRVTIPEWPTKYLDGTPITTDPSSDSSLLSMGWAVEVGSCTGTTVTTFGVTQESKTVNYPDKSIVFDLPDQKKYCFRYKWFDVRANPCDWSPVNSWTVPPPRRFVTPTGRATVERVPQ